MSEPQKKPIKVSQKSPFSGCILLVAVACSFLFLLVFSFFSLIKQDSQIRGFTSAQSKPTPVSNPQARTAAVQALDERLEAFANGLGECEAPRQLKLSADDINIAIGAHDEFDELRESFFVESIHDGKIHIRINESLNGAPLSGENYFLSGILVGIPRLADGEVVLEVERIDVPGKHVPEGFLGNYSPRRLLQRYREHPKIGPVMEAIREVKIEENQIIITAFKPAPPNNDEVAGGLAKVFGLVALLAVFFATLAFLAVKFTKSSK